MCGTESGIVLWAIFDLLRGSAMPPKGSGVSGPRECRDCLVAKPASAFYRGIGSICYPCRVIRNNQSNLRRGRLLKLQAIIARGGKCQDCEIDLTDHPEIADFDHRPDEPRTTTMPSRLAKRNRPAFIAELARCDIVCANCHRIRTKGRIEDATERTEGNLAVRPRPSVHSLPNATRVR